MTVFDIQTRYTVIRTDTPGCGGQSVGNDSL